MSKVVKVKVSKAAVRALLRSSPVRRDLENRGHRIAAAAGGGHRVESSSTPTRARVAVITDSDDAKVAEASHRDLTRSIDSGRAG